jgi:signal transduction histidine kinase
VDERSKIRARYVDVGLCLAILAISLPPTLSGDPEIGADTWVDTLLLPTLLVAVPLRRRSPVLAAAAFAMACFVSAIPTFDQLRIPAVVPVGLLVAFALGRESRTRAGLAGLGLVLVGLAIDGATERVVAGPLPMLGFGGVLSVAAWGAGRLIRSSDRLAAELEATTVALEQRREATAGLAVELERARLATELDAAARRRVREIVDLAAPAGPPASDDEERMRERFARIERTGREALNEMRELLGVLRGDERARRTPGPTLEELDALLDDARRGGRMVELEVEGDRSLLPTGVELAAYRTVQHALGALRGSEGEPVAVALRYRPDALELEVRGAPLEGAGADAALAAARERVRAQGGSFYATAGAPARRVLTARLPLVPAGA